MPESIFIQVGQCGNQVGTRFWAWGFEEAKIINSESSNSAIRASTLNSFFSKSSKRRCFSSDGVDLKARAVLIDMEEGVINSIVRERKYAEIFDSRLLVTDVSGSGNNWACGFYEYGKSHGERIKNAIRLAVEDCDSLESFFIMHSMGGGTGSGLGSYTMSIVAEEYPEVLRFAFPIYPSEDDDVVTSPYNAVLATRYLTQNATCVFPQSNQSLLSVIQRNKITQPITKDAILSASSAKAASQRRPPSAAKPTKPFDLMNDIIAQLVLNLTACARFQGPLNLDLSDVATNMVPFPRLMYLLSSQAPVAGATGPFSVKVEPLFEEAFSARNQLFGTPDVYSSGYHLANALLCRGAIEASDIRTGVARLSRKNRFVPWNPDAWKTGLCSVAPLTCPPPSIVVALCNSTAIVQSFQEMRGRFQSLYAHRAYVHHYERVGMDPSEITEAVESLDSLVSDYKSAEQFDKSSCIRARVL